MSYVIMLSEEIYAFMYSMNVNRIRDLRMYIQFFYKTVTWKIIFFLLRADTYTFSNKFWSNVGTQNQYYEYLCKLYSVDAE